MGRRQMFTREQKFEIADEYVDTPPSRSMTLIAKSWRCSFATIGNVINEMFKDKEWRARRGKK